MWVADSRVITTSCHAGTFVMTSTGNDYHQTSRRNSRDDQNMFVFATSRHAAMASTIICLPPDVTP